MFPLFCYNIPKEAKMNLLLIEDNNTIIKGLEYTFKQNNYQTTSISYLKESKKYLETNKPDIIVLDVSLPDGNGFDFYEKYIKEKNIKTIFLTAKDNEDDIVKGLQLADDYLTKPFSTKELLARINKIITKNNTNYIIVKDIKFDFNKMTVYKQDKQVMLTSLELKILQLLFNNLNKVVTRDYLIESIWNWTGNDVNDNTITVYLKRIREKIGNNIIKTIKGIGYIIDEEN